MLISAGSNSAVAIYIYLIPAYYIYTSGGDQGLLNMYFNTWATDDISKHLPFIYNVVSQAFYSYLPAFTQ